MCSAGWRSTKWLLALMKSAGWLPNYAITLKSLCPLDFTNSRPDGFGM